MLYTRAQVIRWLATASYDERLGLFVGTGFSKAATNNLAPTFSQLLERSAAILGLSTDLNAAPYLQKSYPQIASQFVADLVKKGMAFADAGALLRRVVAKQVNLVVESNNQDKFASALSLARPSWVITTNYDLILEALMADGYTVLPNQTLFPSNTQVPIYHLHGHRYDPDSIRITEEDYVSLLAPLDYQRLRLPLLFLESTTLLLGYALGDLNVRAAMEWARSFTGAKGLAIKEPQGLVVQALFAPNPANDPREGLSGEIILEISDIPTLLEEIGAEASGLSNYADYDEHLYVTFLNTANPADSLQSGATRDEFLAIVEKSVGSVPVEELIKFLDKATGPIWDKALQDGGFAYYGEYLSVFIDVLRKLEYREASPKFNTYLARCLDKVGSYFSETNAYGSAWAASKRWLAEAPTLNPELLRELDSLGSTNQMAGLQKLMSCSSLKGILT